jgi:glycosyltransferase involved in cell wall biosynthesis
MNVQPGLVSVVMPCYNSARFVAEAVSSVLSQTYRQVEVIVVDDGSTDNPVQALEPYRNAITVIVQQNAGPALARNKGVNASKGEFVAFLDADDVWSSDKLARQVEMLTNRPDLVLVHTLSADIGTSGERLAREERPWSARLAQGDCTLALLEHNTITNSSVLVRRALLGSDPFVDGMTGCEDWRLWLGLSLKGPFGYIHEPLTLYRLHGTNISKNQLPMQRSLVAAVSSLLTTNLPATVRRAARLQARAQIRTLANIEYEHGNIANARALFVSVATSLRRPDAVRLLLTLMPKFIRTKIRGLGGRSVLPET